MGEDDDGEPEHVQPKSNGALPSSESYLSDRGYRSTGRECRHCEDGTLWFEGSEIVCQNCAVVNDMDEQRTKSTNVDVWEKFDELRDDGWYDYDSSYRRCIGGFSWTYDWVTGSDLEPHETLDDIPSREFYQ